MTSQLYRSDSFYMSRDDNVDSKSCIWVTIFSHFSHLHVTVLLGFFCAYVTKVLLISLEMGKYRRIIHSNDPLFVLSKLPCCTKLPEVFDIFFFSWNSAPNAFKNQNIKYSLIQVITFSNRFISKESYFIILSLILVISFLI